MNAQRGFTLGELLITLAILATLMTVAAPAFTRLLLDARMSRQVNGLVHGVHLAKQAAHMRLADVVLCKSQDGYRCAHGGDWHDGWLLFVNRDGNYPPQAAGDEPRLASGGLWNGGTVVSNRRFFIFRPASTRSTNGTLTFCDRRGAGAGRALIVSYTGRPRTARSGPGNRALACPV